MSRANVYGQPIGEAVDGWTPPGAPPAETLPGRTVTLEPLDSGAHGPGLFSAFENAPDSLWTYMPFGPFNGYSDFHSTLDGLASYLRIAPRDGSIEIGSIALSPRLQRTTPATEALYLMIRNCFTLGYRRCEWKCDALNEPTQRAAERLGFRFEGTFLQATVYKSRNRDTAWYAITDREWPALDSAFLEWLDPGNFNDDGTQQRTLREMREGN